jgi:carbon-monoxide dehydrogenase small subunit
MVLVNGKSVNSCLLLAAKVEGAEVTTIEGLGSVQNPHPIQEAFVEAGAVQCGFCTPGMVITTKALLDETPHPSEERLREALTGNLCRCTGYVKIFKAIRLAEKKLAPSAGNGGPKAARKTR